VEHAVGLARHLGVEGSNPQTSEQLVEERADYLEHDLRAVEQSLLDEHLVEMPRSLNHQMPE